MNGQKDAALRKAYRWYTNRQEFLEALETKENKGLTITRTSIPGISVKRRNVKTLSGRGSKRADWVEYLPAVLREEFDRYTSARVQMSRSLLQYIAVSLEQEDESPFGPGELDSTSYRPIPSHITAKWIDKFLYRFRVVIRKQSATTTNIEKQVSYDLGRLKALFTGEMLDENYLENVDETHFVFIWTIIILLVYVELIA